MKSKNIIGLISLVIILSAFFNASAIAIPGCDTNIAECTDKLGAPCKCTTDQGKTTINGNCLNNKCSSPDTICATEEPNLLKQNYATVNVFPSAIICSHSPSGTCTEPGKFHSKVNAITSCCCSLRLTPIPGN